MWLFHPRKAGGGKKNRVMICVTYSRMTKCRMVLVGCQRKRGMEKKLHLLHEIRCCYGMQHKLLRLGFNHSSDTVKVPSEKMSNHTFCRRILWHEAIPLCRWFAVRNSYVFAECEVLPSSKFAFNFEKGRFPIPAAATARPSTTCSPPRQLCVTAWLQHSCIPE